MPKKIRIPEHFLVKIVSPEVIAEGEGAYLVQGEVVEVVFELSDAE